jgi:hypothetical protein
MISRTSDNQSWPDGVAIELEEVTQETEQKPMTAAEATRILTDEAERLGADANDSEGIVRQLVFAHGLGFNAWFCVCCELADRKAQKQGFKNQADRATSTPGFKAALAEYQAKQSEMGY